MRPRSFAQRRTFVLWALLVVAVAQPVPAADPDDIFWRANRSFQGPQGLIDAVVVVGTDVYAAGRFKKAGGLPIHHLARFDGTQWNEIGGGVGTADMGLIHRVLVDGNRVYPAGMFGVVGGNVTARNVAMWDGVAWNNMAGGTDRAVRAIARAANGDIYVGGEFTTAGLVPARGIARWDGQQWHALGTGINNHVSSIAIQGNNVYVGGAFSIAGGNVANHVARWDGIQWHTLGTGVNNFVTALAVDGSDLYVGGLFSTAGGASARSIAKWSGSSWSPLGLGVSGSSGQVRAIYPDGGGIYVGGFFNFAGGLPANYVAFWNGSGWSSLGSGAGYAVKTFARHNDVVYVGGEFLTVAAGDSSNYLAEWTRPNVVPVFFNRFDATPIHGGVELSWDISYDEPIDGYNIYRSPVGQGIERRINRDGLLSEGMRRHTDRDILGGVEYGYVLAAVRPDGSEVRSPVARVRTNPFGLALAQNHPNPFNPLTVIEFTLPEAGRVTLAVYNGKGERVATLVDGKRPQGVQKVSWDGRNGRGQPVASGVYFYRLHSDNVTLTRKMILLK